MSRRHVSTPWGHRKRLVRDDDQRPFCAKPAPRFDFKTYRQTMSAFTGKADMPFRTAHGKAGWRSVSKREQSTHYDPFFDSLRSGQRKPDRSNVRTFAQAHAISDWLRCACDAIQSKRLVVEMVSAASYVAAAFPWPSLIGSSPGLKQWSDRKVYRFAKNVEHFPAALMSAFGTKRTSSSAPHMSAFGGKADMRFCTAYVCF